MGRVYTGDEIDAAGPPPPLPDEQPVQVVDDLDADFGPVTDDDLDPSGFPPAEEPEP
jgi:hypothetical protein